MLVPNPDEYVYIYGSEYDVNTILYSETYDGGAATDLDYVVVAGNLYCKFEQGLAPAIADGYYYIVLIDYVAGGGVTALAAQKVAAGAHTLKECVYNAETYIANDAMYPVALVHYTEVGGLNDMTDPDTGTVTKVIDLRQFGTTGNKILRHELRLEGAAAQTDAIHLRHNLRVLSKDVIIDTGDLDITTSGKVKEKGSHLMPPGSVLPYAGAAAPDAGWLMCDGSTLDSVANTEYADLYAIIGITFGGTGPTDFDLPDLRDNVPVGAGSSYILGATGGAATHTLTAAQMPVHTHTYNDPLNLTGATYPLVGGGGGISNSTGSAGGGAAHNNMSPYLALNFIIKI